jgi:hypothetical protein
MPELPYERHTNAKSALVLAVGSISTPSIKMVGEPIDCIRAQCC